MTATLCRAGSSLNNTGMPSWLWKTTIFVVAAVMETVGKNKKWSQNTLCFGTNKHNGHNKSKFSQQLKSKKIILNGVTGAHPWYQVYWPTQQPQLGLPLPDSFKVTAVSISEKQPAPSPGGAPGPVLCSLSFTRWAAHAHLGQCFTRWIRNQCQIHKYAQRSRL